MDWICQPVWATHLRSAFAISSGPLSRRLCSGMACRHITSARASIATKLLMRRAIFNAGQARLCSDLCLALAGAGLVGLGRRGAGHAEGAQRWVALYRQDDRRYLEGRMTPAIPAPGLPPEEWSSLRYGFEPCGGCHHGTEEAYG